MKNELNVLFVLRRSRTDGTGKAPIYLRITVDGERAELSANRKIDPKKWNSKSQRATGRSEGSRTLNDYLDNLDSKIRRNYNSLYDAGKEISPVVLKEMIMGTHEKEYTLLKVFEKNNKLLKREKGSKYTADTIKRYEISIERVKAFLKKELNMNDIKLQDLNHGFIHNYEIFLIEEYNCKHNTVMKYLKHLKKVIHFAMAMEYIDKDPFFQYKTAYKEANRGYLTADELCRIENKHFRIKRLEQVKDVFLFVCYTGLSYSDLKLLTQDNISKGIDGKSWVIYNRKKTGIQARIPLLPQAFEILTKYQNDPKCTAENKILPVKSNQKLNSYLSEIAELCEINKHITMHLGRHTFATTVTLTNDVPIETVSKMLEHTSLKTTQMYSKVVDTKVSNDMNKLEKTLKMKSELDQDSAGKNRNYI
ncbi:site-specific integrase [uncultured Draconibacterium sp.]|uniref:site-specific integrase n=1 Tax=uncultured Draconibacterium sp. TaxID=1573823 RepID=UPI0032176D5B